MNLKNNTGEISKIGYAVVADPKNPQAFIYAPPSSTSILGIITQAVPRYATCEIATTGTAKVFIAERTVQGSIIRAQKSGDNISRGTCKTAKSSDTPYFLIGTALESGKGLISVSLDLRLLMSSSITETYLKLDQTTQQTTVGTLHYPTATFGGSSNYSGFEADGTLAMYGDARVWDDSMVAPTAFRSGGTSLTFDLLTTSIYTHRFDVNDEIHQIIQFPHSIDTGTAVIPHIHIVNKNAIGNTNYNVAFNFYYTWANIGSIFPAELSELNVKQSFQNASALTHKMLNFTTITPTAVQGGISSIFMCMLKRVAADDQPYNTNDIYSLGFDIHFLKDTIGSRETTSK